MSPARPPATRTSTPTTVVGVEHVADGVVAVTLEARDDDLPEWRPGTHVDLELADGLVRQYSLCGSPTDRRRLRIAVLDEPGGRGGSAAVHRLAVGTTLRVLAVRNHFPMADADEYVFLAGGIGITPLLPMIEHAEASGAAWSLHYAGRSRSSMAFAEPLAAAHPSRVKLYPATGGHRLDVGEIIASAAPGAGLYCCGPVRLTDSFQEGCSAAGRTGHLERFTAAPGANPASDDEPFEVHLARTGVTVVVEPGQSILRAAEAVGADVFASCGEGICGTCETTVLAGDPDHRDSVLGGADTGAMMICVSRARGGRLVLDA